MDTQMLYGVIELMWTKYNPYYLLYLYFYFICFIKASTDHVIEV